MSWVEAEIGDRTQVEEELDALLPRELAVGMTIHYQPTTFTGYVEERGGDEAEAIQVLHDTRLS